MAKTGSPLNGACFCCCISIIFFSTVIFSGAVALAFWLIVQPNKVGFHVTDTSLTEFSYTSSNGTLHYSLALNMTIRNPNRRLGIYYDYVEARGVYQDARFGSNHIPPFYMDHKTTHYLSTVFKGQHLISLRADQASEYNKQSNSGKYQIDVKLYLKIRFKLGDLESLKFKPKVHCHLEVPLKAQGAMYSGPLQKCDLDF